MKNKSIIIGIILVIAIAILGIAYFQTKDLTYGVDVSIPAGTAETFLYSDIDILPKNNTITISVVGIFQGDCEVILQPVEAKEENSYELIHLTQGMSAKVDIKKGEWYKVGVKTHTPIDYDTKVEVMVKGVKLRTK